MEKIITQEQLQQEIKDFERKLRSDIAFDMIINGLPAAEVHRYTKMPLEWVVMVTEAEIRKLEIERHRKRVVSEGLEISTKIATALKENISKDQIASTYDVDIHWVEEIQKAMMT